MLMLIKLLPLQFYLIFGLLYSEREEMPIRIRNHKGQAKMQFKQRSLIFLKVQASENVQIIKNKCIEARYFTVYTFQLTNFKY